MTTCIRCNKNFLNKYNLLRHQKSSLKCINKNNDESAPNIQRTIAHKCL